MTMTQYQLDRLAKLAERVENIANRRPDVARRLLWVLTGAMTGIAVFGYADEQVSEAEERVTEIESTLASLPALCWGWGVERR